MWALRALTQCLDLTRQLRFEIVPLDGAVIMNPESWPESGFSASCGVRQVAALDYTFSVGTMYVIQASSAR